MPELSPPNEQHSLAQLEELVEPLDAGPDATPLAADIVLTTPEGRAFRILSVLKSEPHGQLYQASTDGAGEPVWLRATSDEKSAARLRHEAQVLRGLDSRMFPKVLDCFS